VKFVPQSPIAFTASPSSQIAVARWFTPSRLKSFAFEPGKPAVKYIAENLLLPCSTAVNRSANQGVSILISATLSDAFSTLSKL
jgi:hypothetical protein